MRLNEVYHGDCLELLKSLPDCCVDTIVSSPPYNLGKEYEQKQALEIYLTKQAEVLAECARVLKQTGSIFWQVGAYANNGNLIPLDIRFFPILEQLGLQPKNRIVWVRQHGLHGTRKFSARHETILWFAKSHKHKFNLDSIRVPQKWQNKRHYSGDRKGKLSCNPDGKNPGDIWVFRNVKHNHEEQTIHPCQFPEDLISRIVLATTDQGDTVLDPYMGTGTVAVVAKRLGRNFLGAELDDKYYEVYQRRLECRPNADGSFANLKSLRDYVERTGADISMYSFDVQVGKRPTERAKAKIYTEEYHLQELERRLCYEEDYFSAKVNGTEQPENYFVKGKVKKQDALQPSLFDPE